jgi:hypothetical protein
MLVAIDPTITKEYILTDDTGEVKTVWLLGLFDSFVASRIQTLMYNRGRDIEKQYETDMTEVVFETIRHGLKGVTNFNVEFTTEEVNIPKVGKRTVVSNEFLKRLKLKWAVELYSELLNMNFVTEQDSKN